MKRKTLLSLEQIKEALGGYPFLDQFGIPRFKFNSGEIVPIDSYQFWSAASANATTNRELNWIIDRSKFECYEQWRREEKELIQLDDVLHFIKEKDALTILLLLDFFRDNPDARIRGVFREIKSELLNYAKGKDIHHSPSHNPFDLEYLPFKSGQELNQILNRIDPFLSFLKIRGGGEVMFNTNLFYFWMDPDQEEKDYFLSTRKDTIWRWGRYEKVKRQLDKQKEETMR